MARYSVGRLEAMMKAYVDGRLQTWRKKELRPAAAGQYHDVENMFNPTARQRTWTSKHLINNVANCTNDVLTISGAINATGKTGVKVSGITLYVSSSLSSSIYVDKIGIAGTGYTSDPNYFYSSSIDSVHPTKHFVSSSGDKILAFPARAGTPQYTVADLVNGGYHTASCDITITLNNTPATNKGKIQVFVYTDKFWGAF